MKAVKTKLAESNPDRVEAFEKGAQAFAKKLVANFKDYEFVRFISLLLPSVCSQYSYAPRILVHSTPASP